MPCKLVYVSSVGVLLPNYDDDDDDDDDLPLLLPPNY